MSAASEKNAQALKALFGDAALANQLGSTRIAVVTSSEQMPQSGVLLADVLADVLGRLWPNIDFSGSCAERQLMVATDAARSGGAPLEGNAPNLSRLICQMLMRLDASWPGKTSLGLDVAAGV